MPSLDFDAFQPAPTDRLWLGAERFTQPTGATTTLVGSRYPGYLYDASADETTRTSYWLPGDWHTMQLDILWANISANVGNVVWQIDLAAPDAAGSLAADSATQQVTVAAGGNAILTISNAFTYTVARGLNHIRVTRKGSAAADTLVNDVAFLGLLLTRRS